MNKYAINEYAIYKQIRFKWICTTRRMMSSPPIFLRLNSISLFPPTCSIVAEYKCPNTALLYTNTTLVCSALLGHLFALKMNFSSLPLLCTENYFLCTGTALNIGHCLMHTQSVQRWRMFVLGKQIFDTLYTYKCTEINQRQTSMLAC